MAIYRIGGYAPGLIQEAPPEPLIKTPEEGETVLLKSLQNIEDYSKTLVIAHSQMTNELKKKVEKAADISLLATNNISKMIENFQGITEQEITQFDQVLNELEDIAQSLSCVDLLYNDVLQLSDILTSIEQTNIFSNSNN